MSTWAVVVDRVPYRYGEEPAAGGTVLVVRDGAGDVLDVRSAEVILALGGAVPAWLPAVEALTTVHRLFGGDVEAVQRAAQVLGAGRSAWPAAARSSADKAVMVALAVMGTHQVAQNPNLDLVIWGLVLRHRSQRVRQRALASVSVLPPALWSVPDSATQQRVARNPACGPDVLYALEPTLPASGDASVQVALAQNPSSPPDLLRRLGAWQAPIVRRSVGANRCTPVPTLVVLLRDRFADVRVAAITNPALPRRLAVVRIGLDPTPAVHAALASRLDLRAGHLAQLEQFARRDPYQHYALVLERIEGHPNCSPRLLRRVQRNRRRLEAAGPGATAPVRSVVGWAISTALTAMVSVTAGVGTVATFFSALPGADMVLVGVVLVALSIVSGVVVARNLRARPRLEGRPAPPMDIGLAIQRLVGKVSLVGRARRGRPLGAGAGRGTSGQGPSGSSST